MINGLNDIFRKNPTPYNDLGSVVSSALEITFAIAAVIAFFYAIWGAYQYIFAGGDKEGLSNARKRITWAIVGLIIMSLAFAISEYMKDFFVGEFRSNPVPVQNVDSPSNNEKIYKQ